MRSQQESKKQKIEVASLQQKPSSTRPSSTSEIVARDGIYVAHANGIVKDTKSGLEWKVGPDKDTNWDEARSWVESLNLDGGGWRMPTMDELETLYKKGMGSHNLTPLLLNTTSGLLWVWSGETVGKGSSDARSVIFDVGRRLSFDRDSRSGRAFAVRSQQESKKQKIEVASLQQKQSSTRPLSTSEIVARDGIYVAHANGIVKDTSTGLEWKVGPDKNTNWDEARSWVQRLNLDGGGWRMPTMDELAGLYKICEFNINVYPKEGMGSDNITPLLKTTSRFLWVWSGETVDKFSSDARVFGFRYGSRLSGDRSYSDGGRAFAVRSRNDG